MSEIFTGQVTAVTNIVLAAFAIITAVVAWRAWRAQSRQLQSELAERKREAGERRREQAVQVYVWLEPPKTTMAVNKPPETTVTAHVCNTSRQPVYGLEIAWDLWGEAFATGTLRIAPLMSGKEDTAMVLVPSEADAAGIIATATFRDRAGVWWRTYSEGRLTELSERPAPLPPGRLGTTISHFTVRKNALRCPIPGTATEWPACVHCAWTGGLIPQERRASADSGRRG